MIEKEKFVPTTGNYKRAVGVFKKREDLENTLQALKDANFDLERVSLLARNVENIEGAKEITDTQGNEAQEGAGVGATTGTVLGGIGGFLVGVGLLAIPGVGPVLAAGVEINALASTLAGAGIGAASGGIIGALVGMGIPEEKAKVYNNRVKAGDYLLIVSGNDDQVRRAGSIMRDRHVEEFDIFEAPDQGQAKPAPTRERVANREVITETRDIDRVSDPEVVIVDKRNEV